MLRTDVQGLQVQIRPPSCQDKRFLYVVMERIKGGELFEADSPRFLCESSAWALFMGPGLEVGASGHRRTG